MALRLASAAVGLPMLVGAVLVGGAWFSALLAAAAAVGAVEVCRMAARQGRHPAAPLAALWAAAIVGAGYFLADGTGASTVLAAIAGLWAATGAIWALAQLRAGTTVSDWGLTVAAALVTGGPLSYGPLIRELSEGRDWVFVVLLVTFAADTGALAVGKSIGRHRLAPTMSPGKTWEGAAGGLVAAIAAGLGLRYIFDLDVSPMTAAVLGALMAIAGMLGDLAESRLKRAAGVKDSGWLIPGHGGVLDRMDSIVLNMVLVYYVLIWVVQ
jgi:phosphatidate cytidylyltransferase